MEQNFRLSIEPGNSVNQCFIEPYWKFTLGMPLNQALDIISKENKIFKKVDFLYSHATPTHLDIIITLNEEGMKLYFDPKLQRLNKIEFNEFSTVSLMYCNSKFNDLQERPSKEQVMQVFGPAKIPEYDEASKCFLMCYIGLCFYLDKQTNSPFDSDLLGSFPYLNQFLVKRLTIIPRNNLSSSNNLLSIPPECFKIHDTYLDKLIITRDDFHTKQLEFQLLSVDYEGSNSTGNNNNSIVKLDPVILQFNDSIQKVLCGLGPPTRIFYKTEDRIKVPLKNEKSGSSESDYFYNYLNFGVDIMFRYKTNTIAKFILHTNFPDDFLFNTYYRCFFKIEVEKDHDEIESYQPYETNDSSSKFIVDTFSKWFEIKKPIESRVDPKPVEVSRFQDQCHKSGLGSHTLAYGFDDLIFEVMPENYHISSVTLYDSSNNSSDHQ